MARKINANSVRQQAFTYIQDQDAADSRSAVVERTMTKFKIGKPYALTLYQAQRTEARASGKMVDVYQVRDRKDGKDVAPYIHTTLTKKGSKVSGYTSTESNAKRAYTNTLNKKLKQVGKITEK